MLLTHNLMAINFYSIACAIIKRLILATCNDYLSPINSTLWWFKITIFALATPLCKITFAKSLKPNRSRLIFARAFTVKYELICFITKSLRKSRLFRITIWNIKSWSPFFTLFSLRPFFTFFPFFTYITFLTFFTFFTFLTLIAFITLITFFTLISFLTFFTLIPLLSL